MGDRPEALGEGACEMLQRLVRERLARKPGGHLVEARLGQLELRVPIGLSGPDADPTLWSKRLIDSIDELLDGAIEQAAAFRPGRAYCHRCESVECDHTRPPSCRHVAVGYTPTGVPRWEDFAQYCLERKHPQVDQLYRHPPVLVTWVLGPHELNGSIVKAFRNGRYRLLGQLVAGFYPVRTRAEEGRGVLALTAQVAASFSRGARPRLGLNLLGLSPSGEGLEDLWDRQDELPWRKSVRWAQSALQTLAPRARGRRPSTGPLPDLDRRVDGILQGLARRLEREQRARTRRTRHAEQRHASGERPTAKAVDDARSADASGLFVDERRGTLVVIGDRGRTHFFTTAGQHVSSVRYSRDAIARKVKLDVWRPATPTEIESFHAATGIGV